MVHLEGKSSVAGVQLSVMVKGVQPCIRVPALQILDSEVFYSLFTFEKGHKWKNKLKTMLLYERERERETDRQTDRQADMLSIWFMLQCCAVNLRYQFCRLQT